MGSEHKRSGRLWDFQSGTVHRQRSSRASTFSNGEGGPSIRLPTVMTSAHIMHCMRYYTTCALNLLYSVKTFSPCVSPQGEAAFPLVHAAKEIVILNMRKSYFDFSSRQTNARENLGYCHTPHPFSIRFYMVYLKSSSAGHENVC